MKKNHLLEAVVNKFRCFEKGSLLDLGCGEGDYANKLQELGFKVIAGDIYADRFKYKGKIEFKHCDITKEIPFPDNYFDYVLLLEVIEHLRNPYEVLPKISRIIKTNGSLIISTPNILNLKSRMRFLFEGAYEYFREPPLDHVNNPKEIISNLHLVPYRYHELEYLLSATGFKIADVFTSTHDCYQLGLFLPIIYFQAWSKNKRSVKKGGVDYSRINKTLLSKDLLFGRHLVICANKQSNNQFSLTLAAANSSKISSLFKKNT